jgi:PEP-CTERM motif-containing protein
LSRYGLSAPQAAELLLNGGFEDGVQTVTLGAFTNFEVPVDWTPNAVFIETSPLNHVTGSIFHGGANSLQTGLDDGEPLPTLSQSFNDVAGDTYNVTFFAAYGGGVGADPNAFLELSAGSGGIKVTDTIGEAFKKFSFSFVGTGHDTLVIAASTNPSEWFVDDVSVTGAASTVPEAPTWAMMLAGFGGLGFVGYRWRRTAIPVA